SQAIFSTLPPREIKTAFKAPSPSAETGHELVANGTPVKSFRSNLACAILSRRLRSEKPNFVSDHIDACSQIIAISASCAERYEATASSNGPVPATRTFFPAIEYPDLTKAWSPPAPITFGSVHPGKGKKRSRAPVASTSLRYRSSSRPSCISASNKFGEGQSNTR